VVGISRPAPPGHRLEEGEANLLAVRDRDSQSLWRGGTSVAV
jgi:hypothetical protein